VVFLVDDAKPSVLNSIPNYQAHDSERIYRGELSVTFTDDMRADDFSDRTFYVMDLLDDNNKVSGYVSYSPALRKTVFVPVTPFQPNGFYRAEIKTDEDTNSDGEIDVQGVHDLAGNPLDNSFMWTFRTTDAPFEPTWSLTFRATDGITSDGNNLAAVEYGAEDGLDEKDALSVPSFGSHISLNFLDHDKIEYQRDVRPADGRLSHHWFFTICDAEEGSTVKIYYKPSVKLTKTTRQYQNLRLVEFDSDGSVTNTITLYPECPAGKPQPDPQTGEIKAYEYQVEPGESCRYFRLDVEKVGFVAQDMENGTSGWRFFSVPITPQSAEPFVNLGDDVDPFRLYQYDTQNGGYKIYPFDIGEVGLQTGHGYFTQLTQKTEFDVGGTQNYDDFTLALDESGWHPVGNPFLKSVNIADLEFSEDGISWVDFAQAVNGELIEGTLYRWNIVTASENWLSQSGETDSYSSVTNVDEMEPWQGYWLRTMVSNLQMKIPAPEGITDYRPPVPDRLKPPMAPVSRNSENQKAIELEKGEFDLKLALTSEFSSDLNTTFGTRQNAKTKWDIFDSMEPPIPGKTVSVYFDHKDWDEESGLYNFDFKPSLQLGEERTWKFYVYTKRPDTEMTLSWGKSIAQVPDNIMLYFREIDSESDWKDMRKIQSVKLISRLQSTKIPFEVRAERFEMNPASDVQVIAGEAYVNIMWAFDNNPFIQGYIVEKVRMCENEKMRYAIPNTKHQFVDTDVIEENSYSYQLITQFKSGAELKSQMFTVTVLPVIEKTALLQSYPNPFNPEVWIPFELESESEVEITIYNISGELIRKLELGVQPRGRYISKEKAAYWNGRTETGERAASGFYFYILKAGDFTATRKMAIIK